MAVAVAVFKLGSHADQIPQDLAISAGAQARPVAWTARALIPVRVEEYRAEHCKSLRDCSNQLALHSAAGKGALLRVSMEFSDMICRCCELEMHGRSFFVESAFNVAYACVT